MRLGGIEVEDSFCECTELFTCRVLITGATKRIVETHALYLMGYSLSTYAPIQVHFEGWADPRETVDNRPGAYLLFTLPVSRGIERFKEEVIKRLMIAPHLPTCSIFNATPNAEEEFNVGSRVGVWGDGFEVKKVFKDREIVEIPTMTGSFIIEEKLGVRVGVDLAVEVYTKNLDSTLLAMEEATRAVVEETRYVGVSLYPLGGIVGAKVGGLKYRVKATVNHRYCPSLRGKTRDCLIPKGVNSVFEFLLAGLGRENVVEGMAVALTVFSRIPGVLKVVAPEFGGLWGGEKIYLGEVVEKALKLRVKTKS